MKIRAGYDIAFDCFQNVPMVLLLTVHPSRQKDLLTPHRIRFTPDIIIRTGLDPFGNVWTRFIAPPGRLEIRNEFVIRDSGMADEVVPGASKWTSMSCLTTCSLFCMVVATATPRGSRIRLGGCSATSPAAGNAFRRFAITSITTLNSDISTRVVIAPPLRDTPNKLAFVETSPISLLRFVVA